jgi:hypothetical protein
MSRTPCLGRKTTAFVVGVKRKQADSSEGDRAGHEWPDLWSAGPFCSQPFSSLAAVSRPGSK